jgi:hypothetical protein
LFKNSKAGNNKNASDEAVQNYIDLLLHENQIQPPLDLDDDIDQTLNFGDFSNKSRVFLNQLSKVKKKSSDYIFTVDGVVNPIKESFSCHLFKVSGLLIGIPSTQIKEIKSFSFDKKEYITKLNKNDLRLLNCDLYLDNHGQQMNYPIIDTSNLMIGGTYNLSKIDEYKFVIIFKKYNWTLAIDAVGGEIIVNPTDVRWRSETTKRKWLLGTVQKKMYALIDLDVIDDMMIEKKVLED